ISTSTVVMGSPLTLSTITWACTGEEASARRRSKKHGAAIDQNRQDRRITRPNMKMSCSGELTLGRPRLGDRLTVVEPVDNARRPKTRPNLGIAQGAQLQFKHQRLVAGPRAVAVVLNEGGIANAKFGTIVFVADTEIHGRHREQWRMGIELSI